MVLVLPLTGRMFLVFSICRISGSLVVGTELRANVLEVTSVGCAHQVKYRTNVLEIITVGSFLRDNLRTAETRRLRGEKYGDSAGSG